MMNKLTFHEKTWIDVFKQKNSYYEAQGKLLQTIIKRFKGETINVSKNELLALYDLGHDIEIIGENCADNKLWLHKN